MNFRVGQKVVCVDSHTPHTVGCGWSGDGPTEGAIYTVRHSFYKECAGMTLWLNEIERAWVAKKKWGDDVGYAAWRFRPIVDRKTDISIFTRMLTPSPERVE